MEMKNFFHPQENKKNMIELVRENLIVKSVEKIVIMPKLVFKMHQQMIFLKKELT